VRVGPEADLEPNAKPFGSVASAAMPETGANASKGCDAAKSTVPPGATPQEPREAPLRSFSWAKPPGLYFAYITFVSPVPSFAVPIVRGPRDNFCVPDITFMSPALRGGAGIRT
jgi:hypothetical protein